MCFKMVKKSFSGFWCNAKNALYISQRPSRFFSIFSPFVLFSTNLKIADLLYIFKRERDLFFSRKFKVRFANWLKWYFVTEIVLTYFEKKKCHREKLLKFEAEGWEFSKILRSPEQFFQTMKDHRSDHLFKQNALLTCFWRFLRSNSYLKR